MPSYSVCAHIDISKCLNIGQIGRKANINWPLVGFLTLSHMVFPYYVSKKKNRLNEPVINGCTCQKITL